MNLVNCVRCRAFNYSMRAIFSRRMCDSMAVLTNSVYTSNAKGVQFLYIDQQLNCCPNTVSVRMFSKGQDKAKEKRKSGKPKLILSDEELEQLIPYGELKIEVNNVIEKFKESLNSNLALRSNLSSIDNLSVEVDGKKYPLCEIAQISKRSAHLVVVNMALMPDAIKAVLAAVAESGLNINPQQEGNTIYLPIPKVTREHREALAKNAKTVCQRAKDDLKDILSSFSSYTKKQKKSNVSEELIYNVNENLKYLIETKVMECNQLMENKINELLK